MRYEELDPFLRQITPSERWHLDHPDELSVHYDRIDRTTVDGVEMYDFAFYNAMGDNDVWLMKESRFCPIPLHVHEVIELSYVYSGRCTFIIDGVRTELGTGDFCLINQNTPQAVEPLGENDIVITLDMRERYLIDNLLKRLSSRELVTQFLAQSLAHDVRTRHALTLHLDDDIMIRQLMEQLICAYYSEHVYQEVLNAYLILVFARLMRVASVQSHGQADDQSLIVEVLHALDQQPDVTLAALGERLGYNSTYLGSLIKRKTGKTFRELSSGQRLRTAALQLETTDIPIYEIAESIGYRNLSFFYRKFEQAFGCTPQAYRSDHRESPR